MLTPKGAFGTQTTWDGTGQKEIVSCLVDHGTKLTWDNMGLFEFSWDKN